MARARDLAADRLTMYTYIMQRTQIYLTDEETAALDRLTETTGRTKSQLIREAIEAQYLARPDIERALRILDETFGAWKGDERPGGAEYVEMVRPGNLARRIAAADRRRAARPR